MHNKFAILVGVVMLVVAGVVLTQRAGNIPNLRGVLTGSTSPCDTCMEGTLSCSESPDFEACMNNFKAACDQCTQASSVPTGMSAQQTSVPVRYSPQCFDPVGCQEDTLGGTYSLNDCLEILPDFCGISSNSASSQGFTPYCPDKKDLESAEVTGVGQDRSSGAARNAAIARVQEKCEAWKESIRNNVCDPGCYVNNYYPKETRYTIVRDPVPTMDAYSKFYTATIVAVCHTSANCLAPK